MQIALPMLIHEICLFIIIDVQKNAKPILTIMFYMELCHEDWWIAHN